MVSITKVNNSIDFGIYTKFITKYIKRCSILSNYITFQLPSSIYKIIAGINFRGRPQQ